MERRTHSVKKSARSREKVSSRTSHVVTWKFYENIQGSARKFPWQISAFHMCRFGREIMNKRAKTDLNSVGQPSNYHIILLTKKYRETLLYQQL